MKMIAPPLALLATLLGGPAGVGVATPALAKDAPNSPLRLGPALVRAANGANTALTGNDLAGAEPQVAQAEGAAGNDEERYVAAVLRYRLETAKLLAGRRANPNAPVDETVLAKPLDALIASPVTPRADKAGYYRARAQLAFYGRQYPIAITYFEKARELGDADPQIALYLLKARVESGDLAGASPELQRVNAGLVAEGKKAPEDYYRFLIARAAKGAQRAEVVRWLTAYVAAYPSPKTWYEVLRIYGLQQGAVVNPDVQQRLDLLRLLRASGGLADEYLYLDYAQTARAALLPEEAAAVLKEGVAAGKLPAGAAAADAKARAAVLGQAARTAKAPKALASGGSGLQAADTSLAQGNYAKAAELYRLTLGKGGVDADTVNTRLGIALARSGDKAGAQAAFAAVRGAPRADIAQLWTAYLTAA